MKKKVYEVRHIFQSKGLFIIYKYLTSFYLYINILHFLIYKCVCIVQYIFSGVACDFHN